MAGADLPLRMVTYAKGHVDLWTREYETQRNKWIAFYNVAADAQQAAGEAVEKVITNSQKKDEYYARLAMIALSFVAGAVMAGVSTLVEKNLFPMMQNTEIRLLRNKYLIPRIQLVRFADDDYTKIAAKLWGDGIKRVADDQTKPLLNVMAPPKQYKLPPGVTAAIISGNYLSYKTSLQNALINESSVITDTLGLVADRINQSQEFGDAVLRASEQRFGKGPANDLAREQAGRRYLDDYFDSVRQYGYENWFYYGNDPETHTLFLSERIEKVLWQLWILNQDFKMMSARSDVGGSVYWAEGKDHIKLGQDILDYLVNDLGVTSLNDVYWTVYSRLTGRDIEDADDLETVKTWAKSTVGIVLGATRRQFIKTTDLARLYPKAVPLPFGP
jgi:hypothetical protein